MEKPSKSHPRWLTAISAIFLLGGLLYMCAAPEIPEQKVAPTAMAPQAQTAGAQEFAGKLSAELSRYMYSNFSGAHWYPLIERTGVSVDMARRSLRVSIHTRIYPDGDAPAPAQAIAVALKFWAAEVTARENLTLDNVAVFGLRAGNATRLRSWDATWGWQDR